MKRISLLVLFLFAACYLAKSQDLSQITKQKPFAINGTVGLGLGTYNVSGIPARQRDFSYIFNGAPTLTVYGVTFPFSVVISDQQRSYTQPFNQYGISPTYKWITFHAGWQSLEFSPFTLAGHNFLGGGIELNPGRLRFGFIYGRFNKAIEEDLNQPLALAQQAAYKRTGYSTKLGWGTERNHVDVIFLNAKDQASSLNNTPISTELSPAENMVLGISSKFSFLKHFVFDMDVSGSIYTRNVLSDTVENLKLDKVDFIKDLITVNSSTQLLTAAQTSIGYNATNYNVRFRYRRVDPDYKSMGAYYFETDVQNYTVEGMLRLMKGQLQLGGSFGLQNDNILHDKSVRSNRKIGAANISFNKVDYGVDLRYTNFGITQDRGLNPIIDMFRVARTNHNLSTMLRYNINNKSITHGFVLVGNLQSLVDLNELTKPNSKSNSKMANLSYQFGLPKKLFSANANLSYTVAEVTFGKTIFYGPTLGLSQALDKGNLGLNVSVSYQLQRNNNIDAGNIFNINFNSSYRLGKRNAANLTLNYLKSNSRDITLPSFNEFRSNLGLTHSF
ncbi:hypothetical protein ASU31_21730 [Pedobacter ginsenosidimutans]|uniref:DUF5723 domain-containing protein n=1 Tax=Pedobacter ginsenosidimutans TaxID=687842 RepID=A0A0T5VJI4_9SPHI|nr:hypothetical protein [Pedobacter ginsenosidimutans]KRT14034.1 hypothetical protein ASU31_21730 [Pedobacter ginsenosidimutans]